MYDIVIIETTRKYIILFSRPFFSPPNMVSRVDGNSTTVVVYKTRLYPIRCCSVLYIIRLVVAMDARGSSIIILARGDRKQLLGK